MITVGMALGSWVHLAPSRVLSVIGVRSGQGHRTWDKALVCLLDSSLLDSHPAE